MSDEQKCPEWSDAQKCSDCGAVHEWTATEQPDGSYVVSAGDTTTSLVSASACGFSKSQARRVGYMLCKCICLERQLAQAREENARLREVVALQGVVIDAYGEALDVLGDMPAPLDDVLGIDLYEKLTNALEALLKTRLG